MWNHLYINKWVYSGPYGGVFDWSIFSYIFSFLYTVESTDMMLPHSFISFIQDLMSLRRMFWILLRPNCDWHVLTTSVPQTCFDNTSFVYSRCVLQTVTIWALIDVRYQWLVFQSQSQALFELQTNAVFRNIQNGWPNGVEYLCNENIHSFL